MSVEQFSLETYLTNSVEQIVKSAVRATLTNPKESVFMASYALASREASKRRAELEAQGEHIPPFLLASITSLCNLHCAGCFARESHSCSDEAAREQLTAEQWERIFREAQEMGVSFIFLVGGEPMVRRDVLQKAAGVQEILFPVLTNGTLMNENYIRLFDGARNLLPVFSIEGGETQTDARRGAGIYQKLIGTMDALQSRHIIFGASVTLTTENLDEVLSDEFVSGLRTRGCKIVFYIEYVPVTESSAALAPQDAEREALERGLAHLREQYSDMLFIAFPGDEKHSGGCLAAGRGFFHINSHGGAEPCPFSPYSDINVRDTSVREALHSPLFTSLRDGGVLTEEHSGGCVLYEQQDRVEQLLGLVGAEH
ncbi:MAG: radical SAM protein [Oscillospiraceae bacterium]|nr:radical SAM protein [Oscillospiraceae bacterium]